MSPRSDQEVPLRELVRQHMQESSANNTAILTMLAEIKTHNQYSRKDIDDLKKDVSDLRKSDGKQKYLTMLISTIVGSLAGLAHKLFGQ